MYYIHVCNNTGYTVHSRLLRRIKLYTKYIRTTGSYMNVDMYMNVEFLCLDAI